MRFPYFPIHLRDAIFSICRIWFWVLHVSIIEAVLSTDSLCDISFSFSQIGNESSFVSYTDVCCCSAFREKRLVRE
eukprot:GABW01002630.1.p1 GENE.GABW01002630.1~~GABW01002630.1.p1  ORF type:complete len:76 (+),score=0.90 GABW01002630.1:169-396(+)